MEIKFNKQKIINELLANGYDEKSAEEFAAETGHSLIARCMENMANISPWSVDMVNGKATFIHPSLSPWIIKLASENWFECIIENDDYALELPDRKLVKVERCQGCMRLVRKTKQFGDRKLCPGCYAFEEQGMLNKIMDQLVEIA